MFHVFVSDGFRRFRVWRWSDGCISVLTESDIADQIEDGSLVISAEHIGEVLSVLPKHRQFMQEGDEIIVKPIGA